MGLDVQKLRIQFQKQVLDNNQFRGLAIGIARNRANVAQREMKKVYEAHPVTQELKAGPHKPNSSIISYHSSYTANLYSFIGFDEGTDPLAMFEQIISQPLEVRFTVRKGNIYYFQIISFTKKELEEATPMPERYAESDMSWAQGLEDGDLIGVDNYLGISWNGAYSGRGIQVKFSVGNSIARVPYIDDILNALRDKLQSLSS